MRTINHGIFNQDSSFTIQHAYPGATIRYNGKDYKVTKSRFRCTPDGIEQADYKDIWEKVEPIITKSDIEEYKQKTWARVMNELNSKPIDKKGYWSDDLTRIAEAKKIRSVSGAKLRVKVKDHGNDGYVLRFKDYDDTLDLWYEKNGLVSDYNGHPLDIKQIWLRNDK